jgi:hypothetical protein
MQLKIDDDLCDFLRPFNRFYCISMLALNVHIYAEFIAVLNWIALLTVRSKNLYKALKCYVFKSYWLWKVTVFFKWQISKKLPALIGLYLSIGYRNLTFKERFLTFTYQAAGVPHFSDERYLFLKTSHNVVVYLKIEKIVFSFRTFYYFFKIFYWRFRPVNLLQSAQNNEKIDLNYKFLKI